jgi:hypothetical protein
VSEQVFFGEELRLESGNTVRVRKWGWREIKRHAALFKDVISSLLDAFQDVGLTGNGTDADVMTALQAKLPTLIDTTTDNAEKLLVAALENGDADLDKLYGAEDPIDVIIKAIEVNKILSAVGKVQAFLQATRPAKGTIEVPRTN